MQKALNDPAYSIADDGFPSGIRIRVITDRHHASIEKAAAIVGIGRKNVVETSTVSNTLDQPFSKRLEEIFLEYTEEAAKAGERIGFIVVVGFAEVNTVRLIVISIMTILIIQSSGRFHRHGRSEKFV